MPVSFLKANENRTGHSGQPLPSAPVPESHPAWLCTQGSPSTPPPTRCWVVWPSAKGGRLSEPLPSPAVPDILRGLTTGPGTPAGSFLAA